MIFTHFPQCYFDPGSAHMHSASGQHEGQLASYRARKEKQINKEEIILGESGCQAL